MEERVKGNIEVGFMVMGVGCMEYGMERKKFWKEKGKNENESASRP